MNSNPDRPCIDPPTDEEIRSLVQKTNIVICTCTYYQNTSDQRLNQCLETLKPSGSVPIVVVDGSPPEVHEILRTTTGAIVKRETGDYGRGKGGALREAMKLGASLPGVNSSTWLCWQEAEKSHMVQCWQMNVFSESDSKVDGSDIIVPSRDVDCFQRSYPIEQYHSESYGNYYLNCVMKEAMKENGISSTCGAIDWHFGPFAFRKKLLFLWMDYKGTSYDAQVIPFVHAIRKGYKLNSSIEVPFVLGSKMKEEEEGNISFIEKRLHQLNDLDPKVKKSWTDDFYC